MSTVTYLTPVAGSTSPTVAQAANCNDVGVLINMADTDTTATITTNFGSSTPLPLPPISDISAGFPLVNSWVQNGGTAFPNLSFVRTDSNTVTVGKTSAVGSGGSYVVHALRPVSSAR